MLIAMKRLKILDAAGDIVQFFVWHSPQNHWLTSEKGVHQFRYFLLLMRNQILLLSAHAYIHLYWNELQCVHWWLMVPKLVYTLFWCKLVERLPDNDSKQDRIPRLNWRVFSWVAMIDITHWVGYQNPEPFVRLVLIWASSGNMRIMANQNKPNKRFRILVSHPVHTHYD